MFIAKTASAEMVVKTPAQVEDYIIWRAMEEGVDVTLALYIAKAESNYIADAKNPHSSASGTFQFINGTFAGYCIDKYRLANTMSEKNDPIIQVDCAINMLKEPNGYKHWLASAHVWNKKLSTPLPH